MSKTVAEVNLIKPYYEKNGITIYHGDCRDVLPQLGRFDLLLTDPPYGIGADNRRRIMSRGKLAKARDYGVSSWDASPPSQELISRAVTACEKSVVFGGNYFSMPPSPCWLVWDKDNTGDFADCELAWSNLKKAVRKFQWRWNGMLKEKPEDRFHPTQKPLALMKWCIKQAGEGVETILDPFMGSGTTLRAAMDLGLQATGIELEEKYCEIAADRLRQGVFNFN